MQFDATDVRRLDELGTVLTDHLLPMNDYHLTVDIKCNQSGRMVARYLSTDDGWVLRFMPQ